MPIGYQTLMNESKCYGCLGLSQAEMLKLALLDRIATNCGTGSPCAPCPPTENILILTGTTMDTLRILENDTFLELQMPNMTDFTDVTDIGELSLSTLPVFRLLYAPVLATTASYLTCNSCDVLTEIDLPSLTNIGLTAGGGDFSTNPLMTTLNLPLLADVGGDLYLGQNPSITAISLPSLVGGSMTGLGSANNTAMTSWNAPNWLPQANTTNDFFNCALDLASVEQILARGVANAAFAGPASQMLLNGGTNAHPSTVPGSSYDILIARLCTITINP